MEAKSKFNIGDNIYYMRGEMPAKGRISGITFFTGTKKEINGIISKSNDGEALVIYHLEDSTKPIYAQNAYPTKEELREALFKELT